MKIYELPVPAFTQPNPAGRHRYPPHSDAAYGVEQDFRVWLQRSGMLTGDPLAADWHYLPVFWNIYDIDQSWGSTGQEELQAAVDAAVLRPEKTFTICEYDMAVLRPHLDPHCAAWFCASRRREETKAIDIPLLCAEHILPHPRPAKTRLAFFSGNAETDGLRIEMVEALRGRAGILIGDRFMPSPEYAVALASSWLALAPRGQGAQSFRFYEAMQCWAVPLYLSDFDARPFPGAIDWPAYSLWAPNMEILLDILEGAPYHLGELALMSAEAGRLYREKLCYGQWPRYAVAELERLG